MNGWVKLHRKFGEWEWADEPNMVSLFIHLLISASNRDTRWKGTDLKRGQVIFGLNKWSEKTGISVRGLRTSLERLESSHEIDRETTSKFTIITILNYDKYQTEKKKSDTETTTERQPERQTNDKPTTSKRQHREKVRSKEVKKETAEATKGSPARKHEEVLEWLQ